MHLSLPPASSPCLPQLNCTCIAGSTVLMSRTQQPQVLMRYFKKLSLQSIYRSAHKDSELLLGVRKRAATDAHADSASGQV